MRIVPLTLVIGGGFLAALAGTGARQDRAWTQDFATEKTELASTGRSPYFVLEPGYQQVLEDREVRLVITVLNETRVVDGVETRVVEERETTRAGAPVEVSRNFFAISRRTNGVFYFGEDVDMYKDGKVVGHEGSWVAGVNGARFGLMLPGLALVGARYYEEVAPRVAMDRGEIVGVNGSLTTPAGSFRNVVKVEETTLLEPGVKEYKFYAPGAGLLQDGSLKLVRSGMTSPTR